MDTILIAFTKKTYSNKRKFYFTMFYIQINLHSFRLVDRYILTLLVIISSQICSSTKMKTAQWTSKCVKGERNIKSQIAIHVPLLFHKVNYSTNLHTKHEPSSQIDLNLHHRKI